MQRGWGLREGQAHLRGAFPAKPPAGPKGHSSENVIKSQPRPFRASGPLLLEDSCSASV